MPDLVLSTPEGVPTNLLELWDRHLFRSDEVVRTTAESIWSESEVRKLHEKILKDRQKSWFQLCRNGYQVLEDENYAQAVTDIARNFAGGSPGALVDPLLCFFAPLWYRELDNPICIFFYSEPMECAAILQKQWRFPLHFGLALWEYYVVSAFDNLERQKCLLFSLAKFRRSPDSYIAETRKRYRELRGISGQPQDSFEPALGSDWSCPATTPDPHQYPTQPQMSLFDALETNNLKEISGISLSAQAEDILFYYGNLRAGYEQIKSARDDFEMKLQSIDNAQVSDKTYIENQPDVSGLTTEVVVHIEGMSPLTFISEPDSPLIEMLNTTLQNQSSNSKELVYLECTGSEKGSLYFLAGDLLAVETNHSIS